MYLPENSKQKLTDTEQLAYNKTKSFYDKLYILRNNENYENNEIATHYQKTNEILKNATLDLSIQYDENNRDKVFEQTLNLENQQEVLKHVQSYEAFYKQLNKTIEEDLKQHEKEVKIFDLFNSFTIVVDEYYDETIINSNIDTFQLETVMEFCIMEKLKFTPIQLAELFYFRNSYPIIIHDYHYHKNINPYSKTSKDEATEKYDLFYLWIIKPFYKKNKKNYNSLEECIIDVIRDFNLTTKNENEKRRFFSFSYHL